MSAPVSSIKTLNPTTNKIEKVFKEMTDSQLDHILAAADQAFLSWKTTSIATRAQLLHNVAKIMRTRKQALARLCTVEMGKLVAEGIAEVELCADIFDYYADNGAQLLADRQLTVKQGKAFLSYEPLGVLLTVQPWNFPFYQITRTAAANLMGGNTVVLKHASNVPQCAEMMEKIFIEAGAPKGVYSNLFVSGSRVSQLVASPYVKAVSLTGSAPAGSSYAAAAGKVIKKSTLELGGSDAFIVLADANIEQAVNMAAFGRLWNAGQVCISPKRIIVLESVADEFIRRATDIYKQIVIGDPLEAKTQLAPLSTEKGLVDVLKQVETTVKQGARLVYGGHRLDREGFFMQPTILTDIKPGMLAYADEIFGPVLCIYAVKNIEEAIKLANDTEFGLGGTVFGNNTDEAVKIARQMVTGMVYINHITGISPELPFGGTKQSGYGREQADAGFYEFLNAKLIRITTPESAY
ncbi:NAD-dependent succinate-semialdehyde dehydrogenase [Utexia brackfieldae]|uniref:NAD-dependent succinate-semialdehyde dehydrogenase n=1 Tax=Utexia brackfieldae TaxID=3074108 RepID=UPI00370DD079